MPVATTLVAGHHFLQTLLDASVDMFIEAARNNPWLHHLCLADECRYDPTLPTLPSLGRCSRS